MADLVQGLDPGKLVLAGTVLSFLISPFAAPAYNLPLFLFGAVVHESNEAIQSLKLFSGLLTASILFDLIWAFTNTQSGVARLLLFLLWVLKFPTAMTFVAALRQRGSQFALGADISGPTVWSMPGGFTSTGREGYQVVADDEPRANVVPRGPPGPPPPQKVSTGLPSMPHAHGAPGAHPQPGNYQSA